MRPHAPLAAIFGGASTALLIATSVLFLMGDDCDPPANATPAKDATPVDVITVTAADGAVTTQCVMPAEPCHDELLTLSDKVGSAKCSSPEAKGTQVAAGNTVAILCSCPGRK